MKLWYHLRQRNINGFRFRKQVPLGRYIVDFLCYEANLIIEVDGGGHNEDGTIEYDTVRTAWLEKQGYVIKRFWNNDVLCNIDGVLEEILSACKIYPPHPVLPPQAGGRDVTFLQSSIF